MIREPIQGIRLVTILLFLIQVTNINIFSQSDTKQQTRLSSGAKGQNPENKQILLPFLEKAPVIDGNLNEWKNHAYHDGVWDIYRVQYATWYNPNRNRLTDHGNEPAAEWDLQSRYYLAWDNIYIYLGAEVWDNKNDISDPEHHPTRWYYKDCVCWFWEAPYDTVPETFGQGNNAFCFIADTSYPGYGAWWRHGNSKKNYIEEPLNGNAVDYKIRMNPWNRSEADYILEARVNMAKTFAESDPYWKPPKNHDTYSMEIVHTDPDGGNYGGHLIIYGTGDNDKTWWKVILTGPKIPPERKAY